MDPVTEFQQLKSRMRATWMAGDFGQIAQYSTKLAEEFINGLAIVPGMQVLDVACGTGNSALPAARLGARVTGVDFAPNLLEQARKRASAEELGVSFDEGDAENLSYAPSQYDLVISMFGAMFAPRPELVASELIRVCRPGGRIAMANWTPQGFAGQMLALAPRYLPPPEGLPSPMLWGDEEIVRQRFAGTSSQITTTRRSATMEFPLSPAQVVQLFRDYFGPTQVAFTRLDPTRAKAYAADMEQLWNQHNQSRTGHTKVENEYLEVIVTRQ